MRPHMPPLSDIDTIEPVTVRTAAIAVTSGFVTGAAAGLIGVGGGEFRIPVLVHLLGFPLRLAAGVNLVVDGGRTSCFTAGTLGMPD